LAELFNVSRPTVYRTIDRDAQTKARQLRPAI
jgi:hypothetical protein